MFSNKEREIIERWSRTNVLGFTDIEPMQQLSERLNIGVFNAGCNACVRKRMSTLVEILQNEPDTNSSVGGRSSVSQDISTSPEPKRRRKPRSNA